MEDLGDPPTTAYWLAWATAFLLIIAVVSAGVMNVSDDGSDDGVVSAAGRTSGTVDVATTTTTLPPDPPAQTPTTRRSTGPTSTTLPKAASAVLRAIGTTAPPTTQPPATTSTTRAPVTSTTATTIPPTTSTSTTSTTVVPGATLTIVNRHPNAVVVTVNGVDYPLAVGGSRTEVVPVEGDDVLEARTADTCRTTADEDLQAGGTYDLSVGPGQGVCNDMPAPVLTVARL